MPVDPKKKPTVGFWMTVILVMTVVLYPLSYGPWYGLIQRGLMTERVRLATGPLYVPVEWIINNSSGWVREAILRYLAFWAT
jgi:hypothetical protein